MKVIHQIGKKIHGLIHDMETTQEAYFVESFDDLWEGVCKDIFSIIDYDSRSEYFFRKKTILMILLHHQMMTFKGPLHMFFVYNTLMH